MGTYLYSPIQLPVHSVTNSASSAAFSIIFLKRSILQICYNHHLEMFLLICFALESMQKRQKNF